MFGQESSYTVHLSHGTWGAPHWCPRVGGHAYRRRGPRLGRFGHLGDVIFPRVRPTPGSRPEVATPSRVSQLTAEDSRHHAPNAGQAHGLSNDGPHGCSRRGGTGKEQEPPSSGESHPCHQMYVSGRTFPGAGVPEHVGGQGSGAGGLRSSGHSVHEKRGTES